MSETSEPEKPLVFSVPDETSGARTLVIGDLKRWATEGRMRELPADFMFESIGAITNDKIADLQPEIVLTPVFGDEFDVLDVAKLLHEVGFSGRYRAIAAEIPNADMIRGEVAEIAPKLDFDLLVLPSEVPD